MVMVWAVREILVRESVGRLTYLMWRAAFEILLGKRSEQPIPYTSCKGSVRVILAVTTCRLADWGRAMVDSPASPVW